MMANPRPLAGLRVIDLSRLAPGPYATMLLADMGAEVITVGAGSDAGVAPVLARGKTLIRLDLKSPEGRRPCTGWWKPPMCWSKVFAPVSRRASVRGPRR